MSTSTRTTIISCYNDGQLSNTGNILPVGFGWVKDLITLQKQKNLIVLLHGGCLKYGLKNSTYKKKFGNKNPYSSLLSSFTEAKVQIKICELCLNQNGYNLSDIESDIKPVPFSIAYLIEQQKEIDVIYDSPVVV